MGLPPSAPPSRPPIGAAAQDLSDAEFAELDGLLAQVPEPLQPLDGVMLDGFLAGIIVQPDLIAAERWLPFVFDGGGHRWGEAEPGPEQLRARELILRRHAAMNRSLAQYGGFDPYIVEPGEGAADAAEAVSVGDAVSQALGPWVAGFAASVALCNGLDDGNDAVALALARIRRFAPSEGEDRLAAAILERERPIASLDDAIAELVDCVGDLYDLTAPQRYQVETVRRAAPKVGRNERCPCGSGRKFKHCHGKD